MSNEEDLTNMQVTDVDIYIGLMMEANDSNNAGSVVDKAKWFNTSATVKQRKEILLPIVQAKDPIDYLKRKVDEFFMKQRMKKGIH